MIPAVIVKGTSGASALGAGGHMVDSETYSHSLHRGKNGPSRPVRPLLLVREQPLEILTSNGGLRDRSCQTLPDPVLRALHWLLAMIVEYPRDFCCRWQLYQA